MGAASTLTSAGRPTEVRGAGCLSWRMAVHPRPGPGRVSPQEARSFPGAGMEGGGRAPTKVSKVPLPLAPISQDPVTASTATGGGATAALESSQSSWSALLSGI